MNARTKIIIEALEVLKKASSQMINEQTEVKVPLESFEWTVNVAIDQLKKLDAKAEEIEYKTLGQKNYHLTIEVKEV